MSGDVADIDYVARRLKVDYESFDALSYGNRPRQRHEHLILKFYGFKRFDRVAERFAFSRIIVEEKAAHTGNSVFLAMNLKSMEVIIGPAHSKLEDVVEIGYCAGTGNQ